MPISSILTYIYLFCGLIVVAYVLLASYNIFTKGYRTSSAYVGILIMIVLFALSFGGAISSIYNLGLALDKLGPSSNSPSPTQPTAPKGKFY